MPLDATAFGVSCSHLHRVFFVGTQRAASLGGVAIRIWNDLELPGVMGGNVNACDSFISPASQIDWD